MKKMGMLILLVLALAALSTGAAVADQGEDNTTIKVRAPLDAVNCPGTISLLGLIINISQAVFINEDDQGGAPLTCVDLKLGQVVTVYLASDIPNGAGQLTATAVKLEQDEGDLDTEVEVTAPIQAITTTPPTVTLLGLVIDISQAALEGAEDQDTEGDQQSIDITQLMVGQFVEVKLASSQPPLVAIELEVKGFTNQVEVEVEDQQGEDVDDGDVDSVQATVQVKTVATVPGRKQKTVKKVVKFLTTSNGSFTLRGLPQGTAKIAVTRVINGHVSKGKAKVQVLPNTTQRIKVRLK